jgi:endonuclease/exonuclease/phosphatase family metal-dependent hydrolase
MLLIALLVIPGAGVAQANGTPAPNRHRTLTVMTRNLYLGVDLLPLFVVPPEQVPAQVAANWAMVQATDFPARATALAREVEEAEPDLIGLQEAMLWRIQSPGDFFTGNTPATDVVYDFVAILLAELEARGRHYAVIAEVTGLDGELPSNTGDDLRLTFRNVILARTDLPASELKLSNAQTGNFATNLVVPLGGQAFTILRGWAAVDVKVRGKSLRFVTTHLEAFSELVQVAQADEVLAGPANTNLPVVLVGDFNSNANGSGTATYGNLITAGFADAWPLARADSGFTCCQAEDLRNETSLLSERIDLALFRGDFTVDEVDILGETAADRTDSGLWPSDHAGIVATLRFP